MGRGHAGLSSAPRVTRGRGATQGWALGRGAQWSHNGARRGQLVLVLCWGRTMLFIVLQLWTAGHCPVRLRSVTHR